MSNPEPISVTNLDQYGHEPLPWDAVLERLEESSNKKTLTVLGTVTPAGRPHAAPVGAMWIDGAWYVVSGAGTRKGRNLAHNAACTLTTGLTGMDVVFEARAEHVTDASELERVAAVYREAGWPAVVEGDTFTAPYTAPSGGPPPWNLYRLVCEVVFAVGHGDPLNGATKWTFA